MDYETLATHNPRLLYAQSTGWGPIGPYKDVPAIDFVAQAKSGAMWGSGEEGAPPVPVSIGIADRVTSYTLAFGIVAALLGRERQGIAQRVETSLLGSMVIAQGISLTPVLLLGHEIPRHNRRWPQRNPLYNYYQCKDERWIVLASLAAAEKWQHWPSFCKVLGRPELETDARFCNNEKRMEHRKEVVALLWE